MAKTNCPHCQLLLEQPKTDVDMHWCERCNTPLIACEDNTGALTGWWYMGWDTDTEGYGNELWCTTMFADVCDEFVMMRHSHVDQLCADLNGYWRVPAHLQDELWCAMKAEGGNRHWPKLVKGAVDWLANVNKKGNDR